MNENGFDSALTSTQYRPANIASNTKENAVDLNLINLLLDGQREALGELYNRHAGVLLAVAYRILKNRRDAEDVIHDVFVETWQKIRNYDSTRGSVRAWLLIRTRSRAIDCMRVLVKTHNEPAEKILQEKPNLTTDHEALSLDQARARKALSILSKDQRFVLELNYFSGLSCREIAHRYNIPEGTVKSRLLAGINQLKKHLASDRGDDK